MMLSLWGLKLVHLENFQKYSDGQRCHIKNISQPTQNSETVLPASVEGEILQATWLNMTSRSQQSVSEQRLSVLKCRFSVKLQFRFDSEHWEYRSVRVLFWQNIIMPPWKENAAFNLWAFWRNLAWTFPFVREEGNRVGCASLLAAFISPAAPRCKISPETASDGYGPVNSSGRLWRRMLNHCRSTVCP